MSVLKTNRIYLKDAKLNMILAENAVSSTGIVILNKNCVINDENYEKLKINGIKKITIFEKEEDREKYKKIIDREEFKEFEKNHKKNIEKIKNNFIAIGEGSELEIENLYDAVIELASSLKSKNDVFKYLNNLRDIDELTYGHCLNVGILANIFGNWIGYTGEKLKTITVAGVLHDIGKTKIDEKVLKKPSKLTEAEYEEAKRHSYLGYEMVKNLDIKEEIKMSVLMHHEKIDGSGYPLKLKDEKIHESPKIIAICDIYEAMTANRVYRPKVCPFNVIKFFEQKTYTLLDTKLLLIFLQNIAYTYIGSGCVLSNGEEGEIIFIDSTNLSRPIVKVGEKFINLAQDKEMDIVSII